MAKYLYLLVIILALSHEVISYTFILKGADVCPSSGQISQELTSNYKIMCSAVCKDDARCLGFCYNSAMKSCRIFSSHFDSAASTATAPGYEMYALDLADAAAFGSGVLRFGNKVYQHISTPLDPDQARSHCSGMGASLALPTNDGENDVIRSFGYTGNVWILTDDRPHEGIWKNTDTDENIIYTNWDTNQPDNAGNNEHCALQRENKKWNDAVCNANYEFVCEKTIQN